MSNKPLMQPLNFLRHIDDSSPFNLISQPDGYPLCFDFLYIGIDETFHNGLILYDIRLGFVKSMCRFV